LRGNLPAPGLKNPPKTVAKYQAKADLKARAAEDLKPRAKPTSKDDLKSISMAELPTKLGSSPKGLTQAEAEKRLTRDGTNALKVDDSIGKRRRKPRVVCRDLKMKGAVVWIICCRPWKP